jgi:hypothetical protein
MRLRSSIALCCGCHKSTLSIFVEQIPAAVAIRELPEQEICFRLFRTLERETFGNNDRPASNRRFQACGTNQRMMP